MKPVLRYPGGKWRLSSWIIRHMPKHDVYLEPFFGSGAVFFRKEPSKLETINDINGDVVHLFRTLREKPEELAHLIELTPWSREEYLDSYTETDNDVERARRFLVRCWQAFATLTGARTGWRCEVQGRLGTSCPKTWDRLPSDLLEAAARLKQAQIENQPALKLLSRYAYPGVLVYADPPYPQDTRRKGIYANEMSDQDHLELLEVLRKHPGPVLLSSFENELYDNNLPGWRKVTRRAAAERAKATVEVLWLNQQAYTGGE